MSIFRTGGMIAAFLLFGMVFRTAEAFLDNETTVLSGTLSIDYTLSARAKALGSACLASTTGLESLSINPAGLAPDNSYQIGLLYLNLHENTSYQFLGYIHPLLHRGNIGFGWANLSSRGFDWRDATNTELGNFDDSENVFYLGYGTPFLLPALDVGATLKIYYQALHQLNRVGAGLDVGAIYHWLPNLNLGANFHNLVPVALQSEDGSEPLPCLVRLGAAWHPLTDMEWLNGLNVYGQIELQDLYGNQGGIGAHLENAWKIGLEYPVAGMIHLRAGMKNSNLSAGAGLSLFNFNLDYAYDLHALGGLHWISLTAILGRNVDQTLVNRYYQEAIQAYSTEHYQESAERWQQILEENPDDEAARKYLDKTYSQLEKKTDELRQEAQHAVEQEEFDRAVLLYEKILTMRPGYPPANEKIIEIRTIIEKREVERHHAEVAGQVQTATDHETRGELPEALAAWENVLVMEPDHPDAGDAIRRINADLLAQVAARYQSGLKAFDTGRFRDALETFTLILKIQPDHAEAAFYKSQCEVRLAQKLENDYTAGLGLFRNRDYAGAIVRFKAVLASVPAYKSANAYLKAAEAKMAELGEAARILEQARQAFSQAQLEEAWSLISPLMNEDRYDLPIQRFYERVREARRQVEALYAQGLQAHRRGALNQSIEALTGCLRLNASSPARELLVDIYANQGIIAYRNDHPIQAVGFWKKAMLLDPNHGMIKKYILRAENKIEFLRKTFGDDYFKSH